MSFANSIHSFLDKGDWNLETLKKIVGSSFNELINGDTSLTKVLKDDKCSPDIVKQLLAYGGDVNAKDWVGCCPLMVALRNSRDESVVRTLLESGADVDSVDSSGRSVICCALRYGVSKSVMKLLLDNACPHRNCRCHSSVLECALDYPFLGLGLKEGVLELLFEAGADVQSVSTRKQSSICLALKARAGIADINFLLKEGASLEKGACPLHTYPWLCATEDGNKLTVDLVRLLEKEKDLQVVDQYDRTPLQRAVSHCRSETEAIRLLLDLSFVHVIGGPNNTLLHLAAGNPHCKLGILKLLIDRGAKVDEVNKESPLFAAVRNCDCECQSKVIELLLKKGPKVNFKNKDNFNALKLAVKYNSDYTTLEVLLAAGSWIEDKEICADSIWDFLFENQSDCCSRLLVKYALLHGTITVCKMKNILCKLYWNEVKWSKFVDECQCELQVMEKINLHCGPYTFCNKANTLRHFVDKHLSPQIVTSNRNPPEYDFDLLLKLMRENAFPQFFSVISAKIGKLALKTKLQELQLYTAKDCIDSSSEERKIILNNACLCKIGNLLSHVDLLNLILALYVPSNTDCGNANRIVELDVPSNTDFENAGKNNTNLDKRNLKQQGGSHKRIKFADKDLFFKWINAEPK